VKTDGWPEVVRINTVKTLILEFVSGNGPRHIKEIHLQVAEFRPQHSARARLSEMCRSKDLEDKISYVGRFPMETCFLYALFFLFLFLSI
jgi:hypothetical protein